MVVSVVVPVVEAVVVGDVVPVVRTHASKSSVCEAKTAAFTAATSLVHSSTAATKCPARLHEKLPGRSPIVNFSTSEFKEVTVASQPEVLSRNAAMVVPSLATCTVPLDTSENSRLQVSSNVLMCRVCGSIKSAAACTIDTPWYS